MRILDRLKNAWNVLTRPAVYMDDDELKEWLGITGTNPDVEKEVTYYTCLKMLSETMGKVPLKYYQETPKGRIRAEPTKITRLLSVRPNTIMTPTTLWTTTEMNCQHYGNGYIWMRGTFEREKYGGHYKVLDLWPMQANCVTVYMDDVGVFGGKGKLYYQYNDPKTGEQYLFRSSEVMHFKTWYSLNGIMGKSVREILQDTVGGALESQNFMNNLYRQGLSASMALQYAGDLEESKIKALQKKFADKLSGPKNAGRVIPVPIGLQLTPLKIQEINLHINSGGGSVFAGITIYNMLKRNNARITTYIDGIAASIASVIACAGDRIVIPANGTFMIHKPTNGYFFTSMNADQLRKDADTLDICQKAILQTYMSKTKEGVTEEEINNLINEETWMVGSDTTDYFDFEVEDSVQAAACTSNYFDEYSKTPKALKQHEEPENKTLDIDAIADAVMEKIKAKEANQRNLEKEKIKAELLGDLDRYGV